MQRRAGNQLYLVSRLLEWGRAALALEDLAEAETILIEALREAHVSQMKAFALIALANLAELFLRRGELMDAARLAAFVTQHGEVVAEAEAVVAAVLTAVTPRLSTDQFQQAQANGRAADFVDFLLQLS